MFLDIVRGNNKMGMPYDDNARLREQVGLLIRALRSNSESVQEIAVVQLSLFGSKVNPYLTQGLLTAFDEIKDRSTSRSSPEGAVTGIVRVLGMTGDPSKIPYIINALPRPQAVEALAKIGGEKALEAIINSMPKWYAEYVHTREICSSSKLEPTADFVKKIFEFFGEKGRNALTKAMHEGDNANKELYSKVFAMIGDAGSIPILLETLANGNEKTKAEVARTLRKLSAKESVPQMISELFANQDYEASKALSEAVLELGNLDDWIRVAFHRPKLTLGGGMGSGLISSGTTSFDNAIVNCGENAVSKLTKFLQDPDTSNQRKAAEMIAMIKRGEKEYPMIRY